MIEVTVKNDVQNIIIFPNPKYDMIIVWQRNLS